MSFGTVAALLAEQANTFDLVRIIAKDTAGLAKDDRETLRTAADELEAAQRALIATTQELIETRNKLIAVNDHLIGLRKRSLLAMPRMKMESGPIQLELKNYGVPNG